MNSSSLAIRIVTVFSIVAVGGLALYSMSVVAATPWSQDFEENALGWFGATDGWYGNVERVAAADTGLSAAGGLYYAIAKSDNVSGPYSEFDKYRDSWPGEMYAQVDIFLDPGRFALGEGFDYVVGMNDTGGNLLRDYAFHVAKDATTRELHIGASNEVLFQIRTDLEQRNNHTVLGPGWYTFQHHFKEVNGVLEVDMNVLDATGEVLFTQTFSNPDDSTATKVGGNRYAWFTTIKAPAGIAFDNHVLLAPPYGPQSKDDCQQTSWEQYGFKNQGQCMKYLDNGKGSSR